MLLSEGDINFINNHHTFIRFLATSTLQNEQNWQENLIVLPQERDLYSPGQSLHECPLYGVLWYQVFQLQH